MSERYPSTLHPPSMSRMVPSRITWGVMEPCGRADHSPVWTLAPPEKPRRACAALMRLPTSPWVIPSSMARYAALYAVRVASLASFMSAISCSSFTPRHPAVTGVASTTSTAGAARAMPLLKRNSMVSSAPTRPVVMPRSASP